MLRRSEVPEVAHKRRFEGILVVVVARWVEQRAQALFSSSSPAAWPA